MPNGVPMEDLPIDNLPIKDLAIEDLTIEDFTIEELTIDDLTIDDLPIDDLPINNLPMDDLPMDDLLMDDLLIGDLIIDDLTTSWSDGFSRSGSTQSSTDSSTTVSTPSHGSSRSSSLEIIEQYTSQEPLQGRMEDCRSIPARRNRIPCGIKPARKHSSQSFFCNKHTRNGKPEKFASKGSFVRHQDLKGCGPGTGIKFICRGCQRMFKRTDKLWNHQDKDTCGAIVSPDDPAVKLVQGRASKEKVLRRRNNGSH